MLVAPPRSWVFSDTAVVRNTNVTSLSADCVRSKTACERPMSTSMRGAWAAPQVHTSCMFRAPKTTTNTTTASTDRCNRVGMASGVASWAPPPKTGSSQIPVRKPLQPLNFFRDGAAAPPPPAGPPCGAGSCRVSPRASPTVSPRHSPAASPAATPRDALFGGHAVSRGRSAPASGLFDTEVKTAGSRSGSPEGSPSPSPYSGFRDVRVHVAPPRERSREKREYAWRTFSYHHVCDIDRTCRKGVGRSPSPGAAGDTASQRDLKNFFVREDSCQRDGESVQRGGRFPRTRSGSRPKTPKGTPRASPSPSSRSPSPSITPSRSTSPSQQRVTRTQSLSHLRNCDRSDRSVSSSRNSSCRKKRTAPGDILSALRRSSSAATTLPTVGSLQSCHLSSVDGDSKSPTLGSRSLEVTSSETSPVTRETSPVARDFEVALMEMEDDDLLAHVDAVTSSLITVAPPCTPSVGLETIEEGCGSVEHGGGHGNARDSLAYSLACDSLCYSLESESTMEPPGQADGRPLVAPLYGAPWLHKQGLQSRSKSLAPNVAAQGSSEVDITMADRCILPKSAIQRVRTWLHTATPGTIMSAPSSGPSSPRLAPSAEVTPLSTPRDANTSLHCISPESASKSSGSEQHSDSQLQLGLEPISEVLPEEADPYQAASEIAGKTQRSPSNRTFQELLVTNQTCRRGSVDETANLTTAEHKFRKTPRTPRSKKENERPGAYAEARRAASSVLDLNPNWKYSGIGF